MKSPLIIFVNGGGILGLFIGTIYSLASTWLVQKNPIIPGFVTLSLIKNEL